MTNDIELHDNNSITVVSFLLKLWEEKLFIIVTTLIFLLFTEIYIAQQPVKYTTSILVGHVTSVDSPGSSATSGLGNAIALIGLGTGFSNDSKYNLFLTLIKTENFAKLLQSKYHFERLHGENTRIPNANVLLGYLGLIQALPGGDTMTMQMQYGDREFAKQFLIIVYNEGNQAVRAIDTQRAEKFSAFIEDRFRSEDSRPMQDALGSLLVNQERFLMVTSVNLPYAVQLLDGPTATSAPTSPKIRLLQEIGLGVGFAMSIFVLLMWEAIAAERRAHGLETPGLSRWMMNAPGQAIRGFQKLTGGAQRS